MLVLWLSSVAAAGFAERAAAEPAEDVPDAAAGYAFGGPLFADLADRAAEKPGCVEVEEIGRTHLDAPIWAFHVSDPTEAVTRRVLVFAGIHALEWISTEVAVRLLQEAIDRPPRGVRLTVIPILNPDGRARVEADLVAGRNAYRRGNAKQVDLNRDFAVNTDTHTAWEPLLPGYYEHSETPLSQPETRAVDALAARERYDRVVSLHAFGAYFYYPWAGRFEQPPAPDRLRMLAIGRAMERAQGAYAYRTRQLGRWGFFFRALGTEVDHFYGEYGADSYLIELTRSGVRPWRPGDLRTYFRWYNPVDPEPHVRRGVAALRVVVHDWGQGLSSPP